MPSELTSCLVSTLCLWIDFQKKIIIKKKEPNNVPRFPKKKRKILQKSLISDRLRRTNSYPKKRNT